MKEVFTNSVYVGVFISLISYLIGNYLKNKFNKSIFNPLLIAVAITITFLLVTDISYEKYNESAKYISFFLTPTTICLAVPLYEQFELLKNNYKAIIAGILSGVLSNAVSILILSFLFNLSQTEYVTILPKSITTAIGMEVSSALGGYVPITVAIIVITGILGNVIADNVFKILKIKEPIAKGIALGSASHAIGTAKAMEIGKTEGAMSSLSIIVSGILTVLILPVFTELI